MVRDNAGGFGSFVIDIEGLFGTGADEKIANQIVNTFAFDRSNGHVLLLERQSARRHRGRA